MTFSREIALGCHKRVRQTLIDAPVQVAGSDGKIPNVRWLYECLDCGASSMDRAVLTSNLWCSQRLDRMRIAVKAPLKRAQVNYRAWRREIGLA